MKRAIPIIIAILIVLFFFINNHPTEFTVTRSLVINAPAEEIFDQVNDFAQWKHWSPWAELDPNMQTKLSGTEKGEGAMYYWNGNNQVGEGTSTITATTPNKLITIHMDFIKPFKSESNVQFTFAPQGNQTLVTWQMQSSKKFLMKAMSLVMDCDKMIGGQFEEGLKNLKDLTEE